MKRFSGLLASAAVFAAGSLARAETVISTFDDFNLDVLYAWSDATIVSGPTSYDVTDTGFGSGYKNLDPNLDATGETTIELTVEISAPGANPNQAVSGPIVSLGDADGTLASYAWYGQTPGVHVLKALLTSGTGLNTGGKPGLDLSNLDFFHLQDDPGAYHGVYTISFQHLRLTGSPRPRITAETFDPATQEFRVTWKSLPTRTYSILYAPDLASGFNTLVADIESAGTSTSATIPMPDGDAGYLRILEQ